MPKTFTAHTTTQAQKAIVIQCVRTRAEQTTAGKVSAWTRKQDASRKQHRPWP